MGYFIPTNDYSINGDGTDLLQHSLKMFDHTIESIDSDMSERSVDVITDPVLSSDVSNGDFVYQDFDGVFNRAVSDGSHKSNVAGIAYINGDIRKIVFSGLFSTSDPIIESYPMGSLLYLSRTSPGKVTSDPPTSRQLVVGTVVGRGIISINISTAVAKMLEEGIPPGSITSEKLANDTTSPFSSDVKVQDTTAKRLGQIGNSNPEYKGDLNNLTIPCSLFISSDEVSNGPKEFSNSMTGFIEVYKQSSDSMIQIIWNNSGTSDHGWIRRRDSSTSWGLWYNLSDNYSRFFSRDFFYSSSLMGSPFICGYYDTLINIDNITIPIGGPTYIQNSGVLEFRRVDSYIELEVVRSSETFSKFKVIIDGSNLNYKVVYSIDGKTSWVPYELESICKSQFSTLHIRIVSTGTIDIMSFGVLYELDEEFTTPSDIIVLSDTSSDNKYFLTVNNGVLGIEEY